MRWLSKRSTFAVASHCQVATRPRLTGLRLHTPGSLPRVARRDFHATSQRHGFIDLLKWLLFDPIPPENKSVKGKEAQMAPPGPNVAVAKSEIAFLHQTLGLTRPSKSVEDVNDAVFICIDCEAFEHDQTKVTELGVAVLDTKDLAGLKPGVNGESWIAKTQYAHFRPIEYARKVNRKFVKGCEDKFAFGDTTWINLADAAKVLSRIFQSPDRLAEAANFGVELPDTKRNVIFVAHGIANDDAYLAQLGFKLAQASNIVRQVDSQRVAGGTKKNAIGLKRLLEKLGVQKQGLHNAGNDAAYTLQALVVMAVKEHQQPGVIFKETSLPVTTLPGAIRAPGLSALHVFGGTAVEGKEKLPIDGGKGAKKAKIKNAFTKQPTASPLNKSFSTGSLPNLGRYTVKRPAPEGDESEEQPARKRPAR